LIGLTDKESLIHLIDFGFAKEYTKNQKHIPCGKDGGVMGTANFMSANAHAAIEQSRRDDLESIGYMLIYFMKGRLPWQGIKRNTQDKHFKEVMDMKNSMKLDLLCKGIPEEFVKYMKYCKELMFEEKPDYNYLRNLFRSVMTNNEYEYNYRFDWSADQVNEGFFSGSNSDEDYFLDSSGTSYKKIIDKRSDENEKEEKKNLSITKVNVKKDEKEEEKDKKSKKCELGYVDLNVKEGSVGKVVGEKCASKFLV